MRTGGFGCAVQQSLSADAANIVRQAVELAKRRGHVQVTPLHVASTMLAAPSCLLRAACMQSHSHPLQCKALELCLNVALNRLPACGGGSMLGQYHSQYPSISNALVAAFKRAQAHQRRGSVETQQQQPVLAVKIEMEQLVVSILDDPSVSRVMREAGFSSTQVKSNVERVVSLDMCSHHEGSATPSSCNKSQENNEERIWGLPCPVAIPDINGFGLSLLPRSDEQTEPRQQREAESVSCQLGEIKLSCCPDCSSKFQAEARRLQTNVSNCTNYVPTLSSSLPPWLRDESRRRLGENGDENNSDSIEKLCQKWNSYCSSAHKQISLERTLMTFSTAASPSSSTSCFSFDQQNPNFPLPEPNLINARLKFASNPSTTQNSPTSSDIVDAGNYTQKFKEFNSENLNTLCNALEKKVPWQRDVIPEITTTILQCRSGMLRRKERQNINDVKEETWLFFLGRDAQAKEEIARELAKAVFGSYSSFVPIGITSKFVSPEESCRNKRGRDEESCSSYIIDQRFGQAVFDNPHCVFLLEDFDQADYRSQMGLKKAIDKGRIGNHANGDQEVGLCDAIVILSCERFRSSKYSRGCSPQKVENGEEMETIGACLPLNLNVTLELYGDKRINEDDDDQLLFDDLRILESVDRCLVFK